MNTPAAERVRHFGTSIFTEMSVLAVQHQAVNLGQGFPDFAGPAWVKQAAADAIAADLNQYAASTGLPRLREAIAATWADDGWGTLDPASEITVTSGATEALFAAMMAFIEPGDEVVCFEPFYDAYVAHITMAGGVPRFVRLHPPTNERTAPGDRAVTSDPQAQIVDRRSWWFDADELAAAFTPRTKAVLLNTPHNPTGKVFTRAELAQIAALCQEHDVVVISDEVYDRLTYGDAVHTPIATLSDMWQRTLTINSIGKTFSLTGWKVGYAVGPAPLNQALRAAHQWITFASATPLQAASAVALEQAPVHGYYQTFRAEYRQRYDTLVDVLRSAGLPTLPVEGSYFAMADIANTGFATDVDFCRWLTLEARVAAIPPSAFYAADAATRGAIPLLARFCFAKKPETLRAAAERLAHVDFAREVRR